MPSSHNHEHRITAIEDRVIEVESCHREAIYKMKRDLTGVRITLSNMAEQFNTRIATEADIDEALDQE